MVRFGNLNFSLPSSRPGDIRLHWSFFGVRAAYVGMCESQVLDDHCEEATGQKIDPGHFGFAGHNDPVMFRNIAIKTLK